MRPGAAQEVALQEWPRDRRHLLGGVHALRGARRGRRCRCPRRGSGRPSRRRPRARRRSVTREGVRLLAGAAAALQNRRRRSAPAARAARGSHFPEVVEVVRLAEEVGLVRRHRVDEAASAPRPTRRRQPLVIVRERAEAELAQAPRQARLDEVALARGQRDPGVGVDQLAEARELRSVMTSSGRHGDFVALAAAGCERRAWPFVSDPLVPTPANAVSASDSFGRAGSARPGGGRPTARAAPAARRRAARRGAGSRFRA